MSEIADALVGNTPYLESQVGFEEVGRATILILMAELNDELARQEERWLSADERNQQITNGGVGQVKLERFDPDHFHEGPHKSFLDAPPDAFPNVSVMGYYVQPEASQFDQFDVIAMRMYVETICKAGPVEPGTETQFETIVHRRIQRTTEAVNAVIRRNSTLRGTVTPIQLPPRGGIGQQSWVRREESGSGPRFLWQGSRLEYTLQRQASFP